MAGELMEHLSPAAQSIITALQRELARLDDHKSQPERAVVYAAVAAHLRSASPMSFTGVPDLVPAGSPDALIDLGAGALIRLRILDGKLNLFVCEAAQHDASVTLSEEHRAQLRGALEAVR